VVFVHVRGLPKTQQVNGKNYILIDTSIVYESLTAWGLREAYKNVEKLGDRLSQITNLIEWEPFRPILE
jgi:hypothetical protein